jgi:ribosomal-protein-alanine N-acetyltransferase
MPYSLQLAPDLFLTEFLATDAQALVARLHHRAIYQWTLRIPYPYTPADAEAFLAMARGDAHRSDGTPPANLAIRRRDELVGGCGLQTDDSTFFAHRAELGYWVAPACWGQGIATLAVGALCRQAAGRFDKLTACVFDGNQASARVLEKNGFTLEGRHPRHYRKDGKLIDSLCYGLCLDGP